MLPSDVKTYYKDIIIKTVLILAHDQSTITMEQKRKPRNAPNMCRHLKSVGKW